MGCSRKPNVCFQMCLLAPAELLPRSTACDPTLAAKCSWSTQQISDCPNPDPSLGLLLLWFLTNTAETITASTTFHSADCPDTRIFFLWKSWYETGEGGSILDIGPTPARGQDVARMCIWIHNPVNTLGPHALDVVQMLLEELCVCSLQKWSFFMRYFSLSICKGNRELFHLWSFRPWSSFWNVYSLSRLTYFQLLIFLSCS